MNYADAGALFQGKYGKDMRREWWTQISSTATLKDIKTRFLDQLNSAGYELTVQELRLWLYFNNSSDPD